MLKCHILALLLKSFCFLAPIYLCKYFLSAYVHLNLSVLFNLVVEVSLWDGSQWSLPPGSHTLVRSPSRGGRVGPRDQQTAAVQQKG